MPKAKFPVRKDILDALEIEPGTITTGAICVYHDMVKAAVSALEGTIIPVAAVSTGFPAGLSPYSLRLAEIGESVERRSQRNRHRHIQKACALTELAGTLQ